MTTTGSSGLPEPHFIDRDPTAVEREMIAAWEEATGTTLYPGQPERLAINNYAYRETLLRIAVQEAGKQTLLDYARAPMLDFLGRLLGVTRLPPTAAQCTMRFSRSAAIGAITPIPSGTMVTSSDGQITFATIKDAEIPAGALFADVRAAAMLTGAAGNGWSAGQINRLAEPVIGIDAAINLDASAGGADAEDSEALRQRIREAPESFSVAGPEGAYTWHAKSVSQTIIDVSVASPHPGDIDVHVLTDTGLPTSTLLTAVGERLNDRLVRPMGDAVRVLAPDRIGYTVVAALTLTRQADAEAVLAAATAAAQAKASSLASRLGANIIRPQWESVLMVDGVADLTLTAPTSRILGRQEWAVCDGITISIAGRSDD